MTAEEERIDIDDSDVDMDPGQRLVYRGKLFTGQVEERLGGVVVGLDSYVDGVPHGPSREWYEDGALRAEATARTGRGSFESVAPNGTLAAEQAFAEDGLTMLVDRQRDEAGHPMKNWRKDGE